MNRASPPVSMFAMLRRVALLTALLCAALLSGAAPRLTLGPWLLLAGTWAGLVADAAANQHVRTRPSAPWLTGRSLALGLAALGLAGFTAAHLAPSLRLTPTLAALLLGLSALGGGAAGYTVGHRARAPRPLGTWLAVDVAVPAGVFAGGLGALVIWLRHADLSATVSATSAVRHIAATTLCWAVLIGIATAGRVRRDLARGHIAPPGVSRDLPSPLMPGLVVMIAVLLAPRLGLPPMTATTLLALKAGLGLLLAPGFAVLAALRMLGRAAGQSGH